MSVLLFGIEVYDSLDLVLDQTQTETWFIKIDKTQINLLNRYVAVCVRDNQLLHVTFVKHNLCHQYL